MVEERKTLIETFLPVAEITEEAKNEKNGRAMPPTSSLHYWWTRKPLVASRAVVLGALLPSTYNIQEFKGLLGLGKQKRAHTYDINLDHLQLLKREYFKVWGSENPILLDPFGGAGSIAFESIRIGINPISNDYNPVAHLIQKATLEFPQKYGSRLYEDVKKGLEWIFEETKNELEKYYPKYEGKDVVAYVWAWMVRCPKCGFDSPLVGQWCLIKNKEKGTYKYLLPSVINEKLHLEIRDGKDVPSKSCSDGEGLCLSCNSVIPNDIVRKDIFEREEEKILALVVNSKKGKEYVFPSKEDDEILQKAKDEVSSNLNNWILNDLLSLKEIPDDSRGALWAKLYLQHWHRLLNPRQKILFITLLKNTKKYGEIISNTYDPSYAEAIMTYLSFVFGKHIDYNCRSTSWHRRNEQISSVVGTKGVSMRWDHAEVNPFVKGSGSLINMNKNILDGLKYTINKLEKRGKVTLTQSSITTLRNTVDIIVTDPPYYDDVQYAELSEFFYIWEQKALREFNDLGDIPRAEDMSVGGCNRDKEFFQRLFKISCQNMHLNLKDNGLLVMFFAHSSIEAWDFVVNSLQKSCFRITATWPVHTESTTNPLSRGRASIMSSIVIVARKRTTEKSGFIEEIQEELEEHLKKRLDEFWNYGLRGADITVSAMGATLDIITQYSEIKSYTGEMTVKDVLELVQKYVSEYILRKFIDNSSGLDSQTSFYLYARLSELERMPFDTANLISKSLNVNLKQLGNNGVIKSLTKGSSKGIKILKYNEREINGKKSLIDIVQYIMLTFVKGGLSEIEKELDNIPFSREEVKNVFEAMLAFPAEDSERQMAQRILEKMGYAFPQDKGQRSIVDDY